MLLCVLNVQNVSNDCNDQLKCTAVPVVGQIDFRLNLFLAYMYICFILKIEGNKGEGIDHISLENSQFTKKIYYIGISCFTENKR